MVLNKPPRPDEFLRWIHLFSRPSGAENEAALRVALQRLWPTARHVHVTGLGIGWLGAAYRVECDGDILFAKMPPLGAQPQDLRSHQYNIMVTQWASAYDVTPAILAFDAPTQTMVTPFISGESPTPEMINAFHPVVGRLLPTLKRFHDAPAPAALLNNRSRQFDRLDGELGVLARAPLPPARQAEVQEVRALLAQHLGASLNSGVFCHNDLNPHNTVGDGRRVWLVDFECASRGDPMADVARLACSGDIRAADAADILAVYDGSASKEMLGRLHLWMVAVDLERYLQSVRNQKQALAEYCWYRVQEALELLRKF